MISPDISIWIAVTDKAETLERTAAFGCNPMANKPHCFTTPDGIVIELMEV